MTVALLSVGITHRRDERNEIARGLGSVNWDRKLKESTPRLAPGRPEPPTMGFDNRAADRKAHAHAVGLRRVEGFKETRQGLCSYPMLPKRQLKLGALEVVATPSHMKASSGCRSSALHK